MAVASRLAYAPPERANQNLHRRVAVVGHFMLIGLGFVPPTPFAVKDFERRDLAGPAPLPEQGSRAVVETAKGVQELQDVPAYLAAHPSIAEELAALG